MIVTLLAIRAKPGREAEFERLFTRELRVLDRAREAAGMLDGDLLRDPQAPGTYRVIARWADAAAYETWLRHPARGEANARLEGLVEPVGRGAVYEVVP